MIKDRPRRLDLIYINQPVYFVTFATRDRKRIPSLHRAQLALEEYGHCATSKFNVALGRYVIMPDHVHVFVRGDRNFTLSSWIGGLKRAMSVALLKEAQGRHVRQSDGLVPWRACLYRGDHCGNLDSLITFCAATKVTPRNRTTCGTIRSALDS